MFEEGFCFIDLVVEGKVDMTAIDDFIDRWHAEPEHQPLHAYLGMTITEYALWVSQPAQLATIVESHRRRALPLAATLP